MEQQVVIEFLNLLGSQSIDFTGNPIQVKLSPHSHPEKISRISNTNRVITVECNEKERLYEDLSLQAKQTIGQRIRLMLAEQQKTAV